MVRQTVSKWEKGLSAPDSQMLIQIAEVLETSVAFLVGETCQNNEKSENVITQPTRRFGVFSIVLLAIGSPVWASLLLAALAVCLSLYIVMWSLIVSLWAVFGALLGCSVGALVSCVLLVSKGNGLSGVAMVGASLVCLGLSMFLFYGCKWATKGVVWFTKKIAKWVKSFVEKGRKPNE